MSGPEDEFIGSFRIQNECGGLHEERRRGRVNTIKQVIGDLT